MITSVDGGNSFLFCVVDEDDAYAVTQIDQRNFFVRLHPKVVQEIYSITKEKFVSKTQTPWKQNDDETGWYFDQDEESVRCQSGVEFLPLAITHLSDKADGNRAETTFYTSYNGGDLLGVCDFDNSIMLPDYFNVPKQSQVSVQVLTNVIDAKDLLIEPLSNDDWELVESHALWLEGGGLLQQICIVFPDQIIGLYMEGWRDVAYVKVLRSNFCYKSGMLDTVDVWPGENQFDTNEYPSQHNCLRLVANTKVVVIPKERNLVTTKFSPWLRIIPSLEEYKNDVYLQRLSSLLEKPVVAASVPYLALVVHPTTARKMLPHAVSLDANEPPVVRVQISRTIIDSGNNDQYRNCTATFASLLTSLAVPENSSGIHPLHRLRLQAVPYIDSVRFYFPTETEKEAIQKRMIRLLTSAEKRVTLQEVKIKGMNLLQSKIWMRPDILPRQNILESYNLPVASLSMTNFPKEIGDFVVLTSPKDNQQNIFKLSIEASENQISFGSGHRSVQIEQLGYRALVSNSRRYISFSLRTCFVADHTLSGILIEQLPPSTCNFVGHNELLRTLSPSLSTILWGEQGVGKTTTALMVATYYNLHLGCCRLYLDCKKLKAAQGSRLGLLLNELVSIMNYAIRLAPVVLVLDDLDEILMDDVDSVESDEPKVDASNPVSADQVQIIVNIFRSFFRVLNERDSVIVRLVVTCRRVDCFPLSFRCTGTFGNCVEIPRMTVHDREDMIERKYLSTLPCENRQNLTSILHYLDGYRPWDIDQVLRKVKYCAGINGRGLFDPTELLLKELQGYEPLARLGTTRQTVFSAMSWDQLGGLFAAKKCLVDTVVQPSKFRTVYQYAKIKLPRGILLFGPPGTGKSLIPGALAKECNYQLVTCKGPELLDKFIGASEAKVRNLFARAKENAPSLIFFDDIDSLAPRRGSDHTGVTDRIVNQLLTFLDGAEDTSRGKVVYIISATSRPDKVDPALLRPGRLEKHVYIGHSDSKEEWTDLFAKVSSQFDLDFDAHAAITSGLLFQTLEGTSVPLFLFSGADLKAILNCARLISVHEKINGETTRKGECVQIGLPDLLRAFSETKPSLSTDDFKLLSTTYAPFRHLNVSSDLKGIHDESNTLRVAFR